VRWPVPGRSCLCPHALEAREQDDARCSGARARRAASSCARPTKTGGGGGSVWGAGEGAGGQGDCLQWVAYRARPTGPVWVVHAFITELGSGSTRPMPR